MDKNTKLVMIAVSALLAVLVAFYLAFFSSYKQSGEVYASDNWSDGYGIVDRSPRGLYVFNDLLNARTGTTDSSKIIFYWQQMDALLTTKQPRTIVFIGESFGLLHKEFKMVMDHVYENGTDLVLSYAISSANISSYFFKDSISSVGSYGYNTKVILPDTTVEMLRLFQQDTLPHMWRTLDAKNLQLKQSSVISRIQNRAEMLSIPFGKGRIILQRNPEFFVNYQLIRKDGYAYFQNLCEHLDPTKQVVYPEFARIYDPMEYVEEEEDTERDNSYLQFLYHNRSFATAMILIVLLVVLYLIFRARRLRPYVPPSLNNENKSIHFLETVTSIYLSKGSPLHVIRLLRKNVNEAIKRKYYIDMGKTEWMDKNWILLSEKSGIPIDKLDIFFQLLENKEKRLIDQNYLTEVYLAVKSMYDVMGIQQVEQQFKLKKQTITIRRNDTVSIGWIFLGCFGVIGSFYLLAMSIEIGVLGWPLSALFLALGFIRMSREMVEISSTEVILQPLVGRTIYLQRSDLRYIDKIGNAFVLVFSNGMEWVVPFWELIPSAKKDIELFRELNELIREL